MLDDQVIISPSEAPVSEPERQLFYIERCRELLIESGLLSEEKKLTYHISTFGCQMNFRDSEKLAGVLESIGYERVDDEKADLVLYNTCTVRENASTRVYGRIGYVGKIKKETNPSMVIGICACMMQEPDEVEKMKKSYGFIDIIFGTHNSYKIAELLYTLLINRKAKEKNPSLKTHVIDVQKEATGIVEDLPVRYDSTFRAGVNIMYGCDNFCTYCIVPYVRGRERSRKSCDIIREVEDLASRGVKEIMLLGQNVNSYGKGLDEGITFAALLDRLSDIKGIKRLRFMTSHPKDLSDDLIDVMSRKETICRHIHLPLQSGSSRLLKKMNRHYTKEDFLTLVRKLRAAMPDIAITTDIIVGFPGETEEDFKETLDVCEEVSFDSAFTFIYSKRTGTPAAAFPDQVPEDVVKERFDRLLKVIARSSAANASRLTGTDRDVLVETVGHTGDNGETHPGDAPEIDDGAVTALTGRLGNNLLVHFEGKRSLVGEIVRVHIDECKDFYYLGSLVK
ncbi:MAG: tRNA (N6-isopentenyl adenosine(37)-C2)-methylthiotransferase MiaB [Lachnospiraceae bacterium]|nr:tRNA (N6-isopentenyl adenosine(37)-C2)-methylthiotransferase MiaB [Lachnospiraceae bacterium]